MYHMYYYGSTSCPVRQKASQNRASQPPHRIIFSTHRPNTVTLPVPSTCIATMDQRRSSMALPMNYGSSKSLPMTQARRSLSTRHGGYGRTSFALSSSRYSGRATLSTAVSRKWLCFAAVLLVLPWGQYLRMKSQWSSLKSEIANLHESQTLMTNQAQSQVSVLNAFKSKATGLENENRELVDKLRKSGILIDTEAANYDKLEKREDALIRRINDLEWHIQESNRFDLTEMYGPGPYQVEITLSSTSAVEINSRSFVLEMAPLAAMPHSVHHFLRMVSEGVWNHMSFVQSSSAPNVLRSTPMDMATAETTNENFVKAKLTKLTFSERSPEYPFGPYTVAFVGTPGGPDFYIAGNQEPSVSNVASCFATVISGKDVVDAYVQKRPTMLDYQWRKGYTGSHVFGIEHVRLLANDELVHNLE